MKINYDPRIKGDYPDLQIAAFQITGLNVKLEYPKLEEFKEELIREIKGEYTPEKLKDATLIRRYRDFYWRLGIDPTKTRPASEALIRRVIKEKPLPRINTLVDTYNLASIKTTMALAAFDQTTLKGELTLRYAKSHESFQGIGMEQPINLEGKEPIITDSEKIIAIYPYRDSDETKITLKTKEALILVCGVPGIPPQVLNKTAQVTSEYIERFCTTTT